MSNKLEDEIEKRLKDNFLSDSNGNTNIYTPHEAVEEIYQLTEDVSKKFAGWIDTQDVLYSKCTPEEQNSLFNHYINNIYKP